MSLQVDAGTPASPRAWTQVVPSSQGDTKVEDSEIPVAQLSPRYLPAPRNAPKTTTGDRPGAKNSTGTSPSTGTGPIGPVSGSENIAAQLCRFLSDEFREIMSDQTVVAEGRLSRLEARFEKLEDRVVKRLDKLMFELTGTPPANQGTPEVSTPPVMASAPASSSVRALHGDHVHSVTTNASEEDKLLVSLEAKQGYIRKRLQEGSSNTSLSSTTSLQYNLREVWTKRIRRAVSQKDRDRENSARTQEFLEMKIEESRTLSGDVVNEASSSINPYAPSVSFRTTGCLRKFVLHPSGPFRLFWDIVGMVLITYDCITIPLFTAFDVTSDDPFHVITVMFWLTLLFWSTDILLTFITGYYEREGLEMRPKQIAKHYVVTWLILDAIVVGSDWIVVAFGEDSGNNARLARASKTVRAMRVLRSLRLLRLMKLRKIINDVQDHINSEYVHIMLNICKLLVLIVFICHLIACLWYWIGTDGGATGWVSHHIDDSPSTPMDYKYITSLHWSLTQFTPACTEIRAHTAIERAFSTIVLLFGLIIFSSFVSSITTAMTRLKHLSSNADKQLSVLRRYLRQRKVSSALSVRVQKYCEFMLMTKQQQIQEKDVAALKVLSLPLQERLALETHEPILTQHLFFRRWCVKHRTAFQMICHNVLSQMYLSISDCLFSAGAVATSMFFVVDGQCVYSWNPEALLKTQQNKDVVGCYNEKSVTAGQFLCEAALWVPWHHVGTLHTTTVCELMLVSAEKFAVISRQNKEAHRMSQNYARAFLKVLNETEDVTDLTQTGTSGAIWTQKVLTAAFSDEVQEPDRTSILSA